MRHYQRTILKYGGLLALWLALAEWLRRAHLTAMLPIDIYVSFTAITCLIVGGLLVWRHNLAKTRRDALKSTQKLTQLSKRENDVLTFLVHGYSNKEISQHLSVSQNTVKSHLKNIYAKLGVSNRTQAAAEAKLIHLINNDKI